MKKHLVGLLTVVCIPFMGTTQAIDYDSVKNVLSTARADSVQLKAALELARFYRFNTPSQGLVYANTAIGLSKKIKAKKRLGEALHYKASAFYQMAAYDSSEKYNRQALAIREAIHDEVGMAGTLTNLGQLLADQGRVKQGFEYLHRAEKIYEKLQDDRLLSIVYNSLGNLYYGQKVYELAYEYHMKAFHKRQKLHDEYALVYSYNNLGHVTYFLFGKDSAALYYEEGVRRARLVNDPYILVQSLNNLGDFYNDIHQEEKAKKVLEEAIRTGEGTDFENILANTYINYARILFYREKNIGLALQYAGKGDRLVKNSGMIEVMFQADDLLAKMYSSTGNYTKAYQYLRNAYILRDSLTKNDIRDQITDLEAKYENNKKKLEIRNLQNEQKIQEAELAARNSDLKRKSTLLTFFITGSVLLVALAFVAFAAYRRKKRDSVLIHAQKIRVEEQNKIILHQKSEVEEKQKEILDSIHYAQRIQRALLASDELLDQNLPEYFVLFQPKDIVSGDFYWATQKFENLNNLKDSNIQILKSSNQTIKSSTSFYLAVCDSTGHGVPGAFMSLLNITFLNEAINEKNIVDPAKVFDHVRQRLIENISQEGQKDGMDGILVKFEIRNAKMEIEYAAANNAPVLIRKNEMIELSADRMPVGKSPRDPEPFSSHRFGIQDGDMLYLFTDGFADQFGGEKEKKFKHKNLVELLRKNSRLSMEEQKQQLHKELTDWRGKQGQVDDVLVVGIRINTSSYDLQ